MFLPISKKDMDERGGIEQLDFIVVTGDAYVDHPSFGAAIISRVLEAEGYSVGVIANRIGRVTVISLDWVSLSTLSWLQVAILIQW